MVDFDALYGEGYYLFRFEATDTSTFSDSFEYWAGVDLTPPIADAGPDLLVRQWRYFSFNGAGSSDNFGIASYQWTFYDGDAVTLWGHSPSYAFTHDGFFEVTLTVTDRAGHQSVDTLTVQVLYDEEPPETTVTGPPSGATISESSTYYVESSDLSGISSTDIYLDGYLVLHAESAIVDYTLDPTLVSDGEHMLTVRVFDNFGQEQVTVYVVFTDTTPPDATVELPPATSEPVDCVVDAYDENGVNRVEFWLDDVLEWTDYEAPYVYYVYTPDLLDGPHNLTIVVYDNAGNHRVEVRIFIVDQTPPELIDLDQSFHNGILGWELHLGAELSDTSGMSSVSALIWSVNGYFQTVTLETDGTGLYSGTWYTEGVSIDECNVDIVAVDTLGNEITYGSATWVQIHDYIGVDSALAELSLIDSVGRTISSGTNDFYDSAGYPLAYYFDDGYTVSVLLLSPTTDLYSLGVSYLTGEHYTLDVTATFDGTLIHYTTYSQVPLILGDIHGYLVNYTVCSDPQTGEQAAYADSIALPEVLVVVSSADLYVMPGKYVEYQLSWLNWDPGDAVGAELTLEFSSDLEFVNCTYPVVISGDILTIDIGQVAGFSIDNLEITFYVVNLLAKNNTNLWMNATLDYHDEWAVNDFEASDSHVVTVVTALPENPVRTSWWWKSEFGFVLSDLSSTYDRNHLQNLVTVISYSSGLLSDVTTLEKALSILVMDDFKGPRGLALRELYAVWLNLANDALTADTEIDLGGLTQVGTIGDAILECEAILLDQSASVQELLRAMRVCQEINAGRY